MTASSNLESSNLESSNLESSSLEPSSIDAAAIEARNAAIMAMDTPQDSKLDPLSDDYTEDVEMSVFDHLEELRQRIFYSLIAIGIAIVGCFSQVKPLVKLLEVPAQGVKFLQLSPGEFFFVSIKTAGYAGLTLSAPFILYQIVVYVTPGLTRKEKRFVAPVMFGSSFLFLAGLAFSYFALIPAALNFFISYGEEVVEQAWSIDKYFEFVLLLMFSTGLAFQIPIVQALLGFLGVITSGQMLSAWRYVLVGAAVLGAVITPSTDPLTQSLLGGAVLMLYMGGIGLVKLLGK
jgi:sec-independent protein translocase protein TatC